MVLFQIDKVCFLGIGISHHYINTTNAVGELNTVQEPSGAIETGEIDVYVFI